MQVGLDIVVEQQGHDGPRNAGHYYLEPDGEGVHFDRRLCFILELEGEHLLPEQDHHRQDRAQLDHHEEHILECVAHVQGQKFVHQQHVARAADGQPFRHALHDAQKNDLQNLRKA